MLGIPAASAVLGLVPTYSPVAVLPRVRFVF
jgi:hypothetical protein